MLFPNDCRCGYLALLVPGPPADQGIAGGIHIFELAASGYGYTPIATLLNAQGAPAPRSQQERPCACVSSSVYEVLHRERYRGEIVWNRTKKRDRWGQHRVSDRSEDQWVRASAPHLGIVPEELWQAAHARIAAARSATNLSRGRLSLAISAARPGTLRVVQRRDVRTRTRSSGAHLRQYA